MYSNLAIIVTVLIHIYKPIVLFFISCILNFNAHGKNSNDLAKNIVKSVDQFKNYSITFTKAFKFPNKSDTIFEKYQSHLSLISNGNSFGWHLIFWLESNAIKGVAAFDQNKISRVNMDDKIYHSMDKIENFKMFETQTQQYLYAPFNRNKDDWSAFEQIDEAPTHWVINKIDTFKFNNGKVNYILKANVKISKETYLPIEEINWSYSGKNIQYLKYELLEIKPFDKLQVANLQVQTDSMFSVIHSFLDADSIKKAKLELYKDLKVGDSVRFFIAESQNGERLNLNDFKDSIVLLDFFYTSCKPCLKTIPELNTISKDFNALGVKVFGLNPMVSDWANIQAFSNHMKIQYPLLKINKDVIYEYNVKFFPRLFLIQNGVLLKIYYGYSKDTYSDLNALLNQLTKK